jgi:hypothetical protein
MPSIYPINFTINKHDSLMKIFKNVKILKMLIISIITFSMVQIVKKKTKGCFHGGDKRGSHSYSFHCNMFLKWFFK